MWIGLLVTLACGLVLIGVTGGFCFVAVRLGVLFAGC